MLALSDSSQIAQHRREDLVPRAETTPSNVRGAFPTALARHPFAPTARENVYSIPRSVAVGPLIAAVASSG